MPSPRKQEANLSEPMEVEDEDRVKEEQPEVESVYSAMHESDASQSQSPRTTNVERGTEQSQTSTKVCTESSVSKTETLEVPQVKEKGKDIVRTPETPFTMAATELLSGKKSDGGATAEIHVTRSSSSSAPIVRFPSEESEDPIMHECEIPEKEEPIHMLVKFDETKGSKAAGSSFDISAAKKSVQQSKQYGKGAKKEKTKSISLPSKPTSSKRPEVLYLKSPVSTKQCGKKVNTVSDTAFKVSPRKESEVKTKKLPLLPFSKSSESSSEFRGREEEDEEEPRLASIDLPYKSSSSSAATSSSTSSDKSATSGKGQGYDSRLVQFDFPRISVSSSTDTSSNTEKSSSQSASKSSDMSGSASSHLSPQSIKCETRGIGIPLPLSPTSKTKTRVSPTKIAVEMMKSVKGFFKKSPTKCGMKPSDDMPLIDDGNADSSNESAKESSSTDLSDSSDSVSKPREVHVTDVQAVIEQRPMETDEQHVLPECETLSMPIVPVSSAEDFSADNVTYQPDDETENTHQMESVQCVTRSPKDDDEECSGLDDKRRKLN